MIIDFPTLVKIGAGIVPDLGELNSRTNTTTIYPEDQYCGPCVCLVKIDKVYTAYRLIDVLGKRGGPARHFEFDGLYFQFDPGSSKSFCVEWIEFNNCQ